MPPDTRWRKSGLSLTAFNSSRGSKLDATNYDGNGIKLLPDGLSESSGQHAQCNHSASDATSTLRHVRVLLPDDQRHARTNG